MFKFNAIFNIYTELNAVNYNSEFVNIYFDDEDFKKLNYLTINIEFNKALAEFLGVSESFKYNFKSNNILTGNISINDFFQFE